MRLVGGSPGRMRRSVARLMPCGAVKSSQRLSGCHQYGISCGVYDRRTHRRYRPIRRMICVSDEFGVHCLTIVGIREQKQIFRNWSWDLLMSANICRTQGRDAGGISARARRGRKARWVKRWTVVRTAGAPSSASPTPLGLAVLTTQGAQRG